MNRVKVNITQANDRWGQPNTAEWLAESTRVASVSIRPSRYSIERMSDIVFVQFFHFVWGDTIYYGYLNF